jgi:hypothetical protein
VFSFFFESGLKYTISIGDFNWNPSKAQLIQTSYVLNRLTSPPCLSSCEHFFSLSDESGPGSHHWPNYHPSRVLPRCPDAPLPPVHHRPSHPSKPRPLLLRVHPRPLTLSFFLVSEVGVC